MSSLSTLFTATKLVFESNVGRERLRLFAADYPLETTFDPSENVVRFGIEDLSFVLRTDLDEELHVVYAGSITSFCPTQTIFDTGYKADLSSAVDELVRFCRVEWPERKVSVKKIRAGSVRNPKQPQK